MHHNFYPHKYLKKLRPLPSYNRTTKEKKKLKPHIFISYVLQYHSYLLLCSPICTITPPPNTKIALANNTVNDLDSDSFEEIVRFVLLGWIWIQIRIRLKKLLDLDWIWIIKWWMNKNELLYASAFVVVLLLLLRNSSCCEVRIWFFCCCCCWDPREKRERGFLYVVVVTDLNEKEETICWILIYFFLSLFEAFDEDVNMIDEDEEKEKNNVLVVHHKKK